MDPKLQSTFIPKGQLATSAASYGVPKRHVSFLGFISKMVFTLAVLSVLGIFGYKYYLNSQISDISKQIEENRQSLQPEVVTSITKLNDRINSTKTLLSTHRITSKVFDLLEKHTLAALRFDNFSYSVENGKVKLSMKGQAKNYATVYLQSEEFGTVKSIENPLFSDLALDDKGNVTFSFEAGLDPASLLSGADINSVNPVVTPITPVISASSTTAAPGASTTKTTTPGKTTTTTTKTTTASDTTCSDYQCLTVAAATCKSISGVVSYSQVPVPTQSGVLVSGKNTYTIIPAGSGCSLITIPVSVNYTAAASASASAKSEASSLNSSAAQSLGVATNCKGASDAMSSYFLDLGVNKLDTITSGTITTSTGKTLSCTQ